MREAFDIGDVMECPDLARPAACSECFLKEDGTHWPYCSKFVAVSTSRGSSSAEGGAPVVSQSSHGWGGEGVGEGKA